MFAECSKEDLVELLDEAAKEKALSLGIEKGGMIICLEARSMEAVEWIGTKERSYFYYSFVGEDDKECVVYRMADSEITMMVDGANFTLRMAPYDDYRFFSANTGTSFCYEICNTFPFAIPIAGTSFIATVIPCCSNCRDEREICIALHEPLTEWCLENGKSLPELNCWQQRESHPKNWS